MTQSYREFVEETVHEGTRVESRYGLTFERTNRQFTVEAGQFPNRPGLVPAIGVLEGLFLVAGFFDARLIKQVAPRADHSLFDSRGAYGPRVMEQLPRMFEGFTRDLESRQHVLYVGRERDQYSTWMPCTSTLHFLVRGGVMDVHASMRSSDVLKGLPTDLVQFGILLQVVARCLDGVKPGTVTVHATSSHVYTADYITKKPKADSLGRAEVLVNFEGGPPVSRFVRFAGWAEQAAKDQPWVDGLPRGMGR
jgi:hypothetical protein